MSIERDRLLSLVEFAQQSARLRSKPAATVAAHGLFVLYEHQIQGLPGIRVNVDGAENEDEIWLAVERLRETRPPEITNPVLRPWVHMTQSPTEEPRLLESTDGASLIAAGTHCPSATLPEQSKPSINPNTTVILSDYDSAAQVRAQFVTYLDAKWRPWAREEKLRRETIRLYAKLFTLKQDLEGGIVETQIELAWGVGLGSWNSNGTTVGYPLVARLVELSLNPETAEVEVRPRDVNARLEIDWYASVDNPGVADLEKTAKEFFGKATTTFSPFDRGTFEPLLRKAVTNLDANGIYWPNEVPPGDRTLPKLDNKLKVTDTWVLFARPRANSLFLQDLEKLKKLAKDRHDVEGDLSRAYRDIVVKRTWLKLAENASPSIRAALQAYLNAIQKIGKGTGKRAVRYRQDARMAASLANPAVPCWIMAHYRVSESLPAELGCFDLVVIDEASQSDLTALPSLLRANKVLIVGDDKQVSPEGVGLEEEKVRSLMHRFLGNQVETYRPQMSPERSIYDLFKVVFAKSVVMLKEHFRCVSPIIEYSKREFYNHELRPLRVPKASERLDPPLIDVVVEDGHRKGDINRSEVRFIVDEIKAIVADPNMGGRSIGVVSLLADKQAREIWDRLTDELGPEVIERHDITCGDTRTFQGKERNIMFLSMVSAPNEVGAPLSRDTFAQRFNVAASRAKDRMYLVRSVEIEHLSDADRLRRRLIAHFAAPFAQHEMRVEDLRNRCESPFEREVYDELTQRGYWVTPQTRVGQYRIDMVVEGHNDTRLAVECDGDKYHGADKWADDMQRQRVLERAGWVFWRCFASAFIRRRKAMLNDLLRTLAERGIEPIGAEGAPRSVHIEHRVVSSFTERLVE